MGHKNKPNRGSLVKQVQDTLDTKLQIGRKKKPDKIAGISQNYIYSWETYHSYLKHCCYFVKWCKENHGCKTIEQCKAYASEWMKTREHLSVYTQKMEASALVKLYGCTLEELNIHTAARQRKDITRSRNTVKRDRHFSESNHAELVAFCRATGLRRAELQALRGRIVPATICISRAAARADGNAMRRLSVIKIWSSVCASKQETEKYLKKFRPVWIFTAIGATMQRRFTGNMRDHWNN